MSSLLNSVLDVCSSHCVCTWVAWYSVELLMLCLPLMLFGLILHVKQAPLHVATKLASIRRSSFFCPSPNTYAHSGVKWIGYEPLCSPYWPHSLLWKIVKWLPESLFDALRFKACMDVRRRGKAKEARKKDLF